jgi:hypothetical protein
VPAGSFAVPLRRWLGLALPLLAGLSLAARAAPPETAAFIAKPIVPLAASAGGQAFGVLYVSAPVRAATADGAAHISARLWMKGDADPSGPLFDTPNGIEVGRIENAPPANAQPGEQREGYTAIAVAGFVPADALTDTLQPIWDTAEQTYEFSCGGCHQLYSPNAYSPDEWSNEMATMAGDAKLPPEDAMLLLKYLQNAARANPPAK